MAMSMVISELMARKDMMVVSVPDPAINGKAMGTIVPDFTSWSLLKNSSPKTISNPKIKITMEMNGYLRQECVKMARLKIKTTP